MLNPAKIRALRIAKGFTLEEAARLAGLHGRQHWYLIESGRAKDPTIHTVASMARVLGVAVDDLLKPKNERCEDE